MTAKYLFAGFIMLALAAFFDLVTIPGRHVIVLAFASLFAITAMYFFGIVYRHSRTLWARLGVAVLFLPCLLLLGDVAYRVLR